MTDEYTITSIKYGACNDFFLDGIILPSMTRISRQHFFSQLDFNKYFS